MADFGLFGLGVMGQNFALNVAEHGFTIAVNNRSPDKVDTTVKRAQEELGDKVGNLKGYKDAKEFVAALAKPRKVMFLVTAGPTVDKVINNFGPLLEPGDMLIDGGNEWYQNSEKRATEIAEKYPGVQYVAMGVSGGEEGARKGPSIMPGGPVEAYKALEPILQKVSAQVEGEPCVTHCGVGSGCGNYVKMVHNGVEYGDMQLIGEAYTVLKMVGGLSNDELSNVFAEWNKSELDSFLIQITSEILAKKDVDCQNVATGEKNEEDTSRYMVDMILDRTGNKGTGKMTIKEGADRATACPTMSAALDTRFISFEKDVRKKMQGVLTGPDVPQVEDKGMLIEDVKNALYCSKIMSYAQGLNLIREASKANDWNVNLGECARIWRGGCIIRAGFLNRIKSAYDRNPTLESLLIDPTFSREVLDRQRAWRRIVALNAQIGLPCPAFAGSLAYFDMYRRETLPGASLVQAQRDYFGSHTYERKDKPLGEMYHCLWSDAHNAATANANKANAEDK